MITQQQALEALYRVLRRHGSTQPDITNDDWNRLYLVRQYIEQQAEDAELLDWLMRKLPGYVSRRLVGDLSDTGDMEEFRAAIRAARAAERKA